MNALSNTHSGTSAGGMLLTLFVIGWFANGGSPGMTEAAATIAAFGAAALCLVALVVRRIKRRREQHQTGNAHGANSLHAEPTSSERRRIPRTIAWISLRSISFLLPKAERDEWLSFTWAAFLDGSGIKRWYYLSDSVVKLPAAAWTSLQIRQEEKTLPAAPVAALADCAETASSEASKRPGQAALNSLWSSGRRSVQWTTRQACRPMDWAVAAYSRFCSVVVTIGVTAVTWLTVKDGFSRVWDDLEQVGVLTGLSSAGLYGWGKLRGIKMRAHGKAPQEELASVPND